MIKSRGFLSARIWFLLPAAVWTISFTVYPLIKSLVLSFEHVQLGRPIVFAGFENYAQAFESRQFWDALSFTLLLWAVTASLALVLGLVLAVFVSRQGRGRTAYRVLLMLPLFATPVGIGYLAVILFSQNGPITGLLGVVRGLVALLGVHASFAIQWGSSPFWASAAVIALEVWEWTPFSFLILLAGVQGIPEEIYEAASLETANGWVVFRSLTLPLLKPMIGIALLLTTVELFKALDIPFGFTRGGPGIATQTYTMLVWRTAFTAFNLGAASAQGFLLLVAVMLLVNASVQLGGLRRSLFEQSR